MNGVRISFRILLSLLLSAAAFCDETSVADWQVKSLPFRALNVTSVGSALWVCGTDESVATSLDGGEHWLIKHQKPNGGALLSIGFADERFGYAAGSSGSLLTTEDGGETWNAHSAGKEAILQTSFSDTKHGLIRTSSSLLFTVDGGSNWSEVSSGQNSEEIKSYPYTFSLVALDSSHMAIMMKNGSAQYHGQGFLMTGDAGRSWKFLNIPNVTLYSFLRVDGKYWAVGTEVIHKDQPGGGYGVPVALYSSDGEKWEHSNHDLAACRLHMCVTCTSTGCLSVNGTVTNFFSDKTSYKGFSPSRELTAKWALAGSAFCIVGSGLKCTSVKSVAEPAESDLASPTAMTAGPLGVPRAQGLSCIICPIERIAIDDKVQGSYNVKLALEIAPNGTVKAALAEGAPTPGIKTRIEQQAQDWIFEPYLKDGVAVSVKMNTSIHINVMRSR